MTATTGQAAQTDNLPESPWPLWKRLGFRVALIFGLLSYFGGQDLPFIWGRAGPLSGGQTSGPESLALFVVQGLYVLIAVLAALLWEPLDRRGTLTRRLFWPTHTTLRLLLAFYLFHYGWNKIFLMQMPVPSTTDLLTTFGEMSHMGLLWRTVGASPLFQFVGGLTEVVPAFLLLFRRTALPGALLGAGVMVFVFLLNLSFNVFVKIFSGTMLLMALFLLTPYLPALSAVVLNRPAPVVTFPARPTNRPLIWAGWAARAVVIGYVVWVPLKGNLDWWVKWRPIPVTHSLGGLYTALEDSRPGAVRLAEDCRWRHLALGQKQSSESAANFVIERVGCKRQFGKYEASGSQLKLGEEKLTWERLENGELRLSGAPGPDAYTVTLRPADTDKTFMADQKFSWTTEKGENR